MITHGRARWGTALPSGAGGEPPHGPHVPATRRAPERQAALATGQAPALSGGPRVSPG